MKKRLLAMLLVLMMVVSLLPTGALADGTSKPSLQGFFTLNYKNDGAMKNTINVNLYNVDGEEIDTLTIDDARTAAHTVTVSLAESIRSDYDIEYVTVSGATDSVWNQRLDSYSVNLSSYTNDGAVINVYLCDALVIPDGLIEYGENGDVTSTRYYRIYDDQILKILHDKKVDVSASTTITAIKPNWKHEFSENNREFDDLNRETDYWALTVTSDDANVAKVQPTNISSLTISYTGDSGSGEVIVPTGDLRYLKDTEAGADRYYRIELNDDSFHIVYFYHEVTFGNNYDLYDVAFVDHGGSVGNDMPAPPIYQDEEKVEFVAWTYDIDGGEPFLETSVVNKDTTVYEQRTSNAAGVISPDIRVMNNENRLKNLVIERTGSDRVDFATMKVTVCGKNGEQTNPDYAPAGGLLYNKWEQGDPWYLVFNYPSGAAGTGSENKRIFINDIEKIIINVKDTSGKDLGPIEVYKGIYDGDFWVSTGKGGSSVITELYINVNNTENPDQPDPPEPEVPRDPTDTELGKLAVVLECTNDEVEHAEKTKVFHLRTTNSKCEIQQVGKECICSVTPDYDKILSTYNTATKATHEYEDEGKQFVLTWNASNNAWENAGDVASITRQVKCETPEQQTRPVMLFIYQNGDTENAVKTIKLDDVVVGGQYSTTVDALDELVKEHYIPGKGATGEYVIEGYYNDGGWNQYRAGDKDNKLDLTQPITVNDGWYNIHVMVTDYEKVQILIYRDGDTTTPYKTIPLENMLKGDTLDISTLEDISTYYTKEDMNKFATGFEWEGWFNDGAWNNYKNADCPKDVKGLDEIYINGWTNVIAMVWDVYPVNYHVLDEDGKEIDTHHDTITARELDKGTWTPEVKPGYEFDGWYQKADDIGNESKKFGGSFVLKKYELYGEMVSLAPEEGPDEEDLAQLTVLVKDNSGAINHGNETFGLVDDCYTTSGITETEGVYTYTITPTVAEYVKLYDIAQGFVEGSHTATTSQSKVHSFVFTWTDGEWVLTSENSVTIGVKCSVTVPTADELAELLQIRVKDYAGAEELPVGVTDHGQFVTGILEDTYSITEPTAENNTFVATVTLTDGSAYAAAYDENKQLDAGTHALTTTVSKLDPITLTYDFTTGTWSASDTGWSLGVKCKQVIYTIHVSFVGPNGENYGSGDVISTMPDVSVEIADPVAEGKTFVGWKKLVGLEEIYTGEFTYTALAALVGDNFTPDTHETWLEFEAVFEDETVEPDPYYIINIRFVDSDGTTSLGGGDVISTSPDAAYPSVPSPVAPQGMKFAGWKVWLGNEPMYEGAFTYKALKALREELDGEITWVDGRTWITFQAVYEDVTVEPDPGVTGFTKTLVTDRDLYNARGIAYPDFYRGTVIVDEGDRVTLIYNITVKGTAGTEFTVRDDSADFAQTGVIPSSGETSFYVAKTFSWRDVRNAGDTLDNTASVSVDGETVKTDTERVPVDIDWDINVPDIDDDDDDDDTVYIPNWLNTTDHYAYIVGYEDGTIRPQNNITRAEVATIFFRLLTDNARERYWSTTNDFSDIAAESWYNNAISTLSNMGIINGYEDGTFKPNAPITRAEFTAIATRFFDYEAEYDGAFNDVSARAWYADYVQAAVDMGLVDGYPDGGFHPDAYITRAEACTIVNRVLHRVPHEDHLLSESVMNTWPDNPKSAWYYEDMQEATNSHDYDWIRDDGETVEDWTKKLPERDWSALETEWATAYSR